MGREHPPEFALPPAEAFRPLVWRQLPGQATTHQARSGIDTGTYAIYERAEGFLTSPPSMPPMPVTTHETLEGAKDAVWRYHVERAAHLVVKDRSLAWRPLVRIGRLLTERGLRYAAAAVEPVARVRIHTSRSAPVTPDAGPGTLIAPLIFEDFKPEWRIAFTIRGTYHVRREFADYQKTRSHFIVEDPGGLIHGGRVSLEAAEALAQTIHVGWVQHLLLPGS